MPLRSLRAAVLALPRVPGAAALTGTDPQDSPALDFAAAVPGCTWVDWSAYAVQASDGTLFGFTGGCCEVPCSTSCTAHGRMQLSPSHCSTAHEVLIQMIENLYQFWPQVWLACLPLLPWPTTPTVLVSLREVHPRLLPHLVWFMSSSHVVDCLARCQALLLRFWPTTCGLQRGCG
jgi:hypothetical protein